MELKELTQSSEAAHLKVLPKKRNLSPRDKLVAKLKSLVGQEVWCAELENQVPRKWENHGDLVLLPANSFTNEEWNILGDDLWSVVCKCLNAKRVARKHSIMANDYRSPQVEILKGASSWVRHVDNKIIYEFDITKCMFSMGNINEKLRIANMDCRNEVVVDMFAGIGYFTLPYLVHAKADKVIACEWNPDAISALRHNLKLNKMEKRCEVFEGDCRKVCPNNVADRINLGLIPSSVCAWETACKALKKNGGVMHIHGNVDLVEPSLSYSSKQLWWKWGDEVKNTITTLSIELGKKWNVQMIDVRRIKSYAAHVDHVVVDISCKMLS